MSRATLDWRNSRSSFSKRSRTSAIVKNGEETSNFIATSICYELLGNVLDIIEKNYLEKQSYLFVVQCAYEALIKIISLNFYNHSEIANQNWIATQPPEPSPPDTWATHCVAVRKISTPIYYEGDSLTELQPSKVNQDHDSIASFEVIYENKSQAEYSSFSFQSSNGNYSLSTDDEIYADRRTLNTPVSTKTALHLESSEHSTTSCFMRFAKDVNEGMEGKKPKTRTSVASTKLSARLCRLDTTETSSLNEQRKPPPQLVQLPPIRKQTNVISWPT